ncbi:NAD(P)/FAD-dependent oxidoreductase [Phaeobacter sp. 22II1-1F12B]|uniref:dihydrolipoyl dehydrogenase family protein n=1 Tax=Phaeobacter sp. 22II1-1F12B TaxID=1317111 RepID=UPI000B5283B2|nr:FAD-dependent oxidoreductase [Phaeobacter sp. 22II1-1F12B]OWU73784.1 dihydrolipoamide dehydrogenase [Phaeobacter sp. 22II1-1F12B]
MERIKTDILVIGAGSAGLSVAAGAVQMGAKVVLLEGHKMGGDCLNYGCVPSKALIASAKVAHQQAHSAPFGVANVVPDVDYKAVMEHVAGVIETIAPVDSEERFEGLGVRVIREFGHFISKSEVQAGDTIISARRIVIATGARPMVPPIKGLDSVDYLTNVTLFDLREKPEHLLIIGGGPIGMEMAQAHRRLGARVTVIEGSKVLGRGDPELVRHVTEALTGEGVEIVEEAEVSTVEQVDGGIQVSCEDGRAFTGSHLLVAVGRISNTEKLNLGAAGVETTDKGIRTDGGLRTTNRRVYAIGDVAGGMQFTHVAGYHAGVVIRSLLFALPSRAKTDHIPQVTYCDPELAQIGLTEDGARAMYGDQTECVRFSYAENDRAQAERKTDGMIKVVVVKGRPVGASIVGHQAGEHINLWALVLANKMKMSQIAGMVSPYPIIGEISKRAAGAYFSPKLFDNKTVKLVLGAIQRWLP